MMKQSILLLYVFYNHKHNVERLVEEMKIVGLDIDVLCVSNGEGSLSIKKYRFLFGLLKILHKNRIHVFNSISARLTPFLLTSLVKKYHHVDFHSFYPVYYNAINCCINNNIKYDITFWGSDLLKATEEKRIKMKKGLDNAAVIKVMGTGLSEAVNSIYKGCYDEKVRIVDFGNIEFEYIDKLLTKSISVDPLFPVHDKIIVTCGYNGSRNQNHLFVINTIRDLPVDIKRKLHLVFPLTYGCDQGYIELINSSVLETNVTYTILTKYLDQNQIAFLRCYSDVMINMLDTDAFSGSVQGHVYAGSVLISGDWLDYKELDVSGAFYIKTPKSELMSSLVKVLVNCGYYKQKCQRNKQIMKEMNSWDSVAVKWVNSYMNQD